jgi:hypothetical protein
VDQPLPCIVCGTQPKSVSPGSDFFWQPLKAVMFDAGSGNYGSSVWDEMGDRSMWINVCDECLVSHKDRVAVVRKIRTRPEVKFAMWQGPEDVDDDD